MVAARTRKRATTGTWIVRGLVAIVLGGALGAAGGVMSVRTLEPGHPEQADSLQIMLDSLSKGAVKKVIDTAATATLSRRAADSLDAAQRLQRVADSIANAQNTAPVTPATASNASGRRSREPLS